MPLLGGMAWHGMAAMSVEMWGTWWEDMENHLENIGKCCQQFHSFRDASNGGRELPSWDLLGNSEQEISSRSM